MLITKANQLQTWLNTLHDIFVGRRVAEGRESSADLAFVCLSEAVPAPHEAPAAFWPCSAGSTPLSSWRRRSCPLSGLSLLRG